MTPPLVNTRGAAGLPAVRPLPPLPCPRCYGLMLGPTCRRCAA